MPAPAPLRAPTPTAAPPAITPAAEATPSAIETGNMAASEELKAAANNSNDTFGQIVERLDSLSLHIGAKEISILDVVVVIIVVAGIWALGRLINRIALRLLRRVTGLDATQKILAEKLTTIAVWSFAVLAGVDFLGIDLTALTVFSGAFGLAIGFGLQKTFGNLIAGLILLMDKSIKPGDVIAVADHAGNSTFGQIRKIGIRAVSITTRDQKEYLIPNENLMVNQVENWSYSSRDMRIQIPISVSYNSDMQLVEKLLLESAVKCKRIIANPAAEVWMKNFGDSGLEFTIQGWISDPEEGLGNIRSEILNNVWKAFQEHHIEIPFPHRTLLLGSNPKFAQLMGALTPAKSSPAKKDK